MLAAIAAENGNRGFPRPAGQGPGGHLKSRAVGGEVVGEPGEPFPLGQVAIAQGDSRGVCAHGRLVLRVTPADTARA